MKYIIALALMLTVAASAMPALADGGYNPGDWNNPATLEAEGYVQAAAAASSGYSGNSGYSGYSGNSDYYYHSGASTLPRDYSYSPGYGYNPSFYYYYSYPNSFYVSPGYMSYYSNPLYSYYPYYSPLWKDTIYISYATAGSGYYARLSYYSYDPTPAEQPVVTQPAQSWPPQQPKTNLGPKAALYKY